jgi:hypothetical protein
MRTKDAEHRVCYFLPEEKCKKLDAEKKLVLCLDARQHNFPVGTVIRISDEEFAKVIDKKHTFLAIKKGRISLAYEYILEPEKERGTHD